MLSSPGGVRVGMADDGQETKVRRVGLTLGTMMGLFVFVVAIVVVLVWVL